MGYTPYSYRTGRLNKFLKHNVMDNFTISSPNLSDMIDGLSPLVDTHKVFTIEEFKAHIGSEQPLRGIVFTSPKTNRKIKVLLLGREAIGFIRGDYVPSKESVINCFTALKFQTDIYVLSNIVFNKLEQSVLDF